MLSSSRHGTSPPGQRSQQKLPRSQGQRAQPKSGLDQACRSRQGQRARQRELLQRKMGVVVGLRTKELSRILEGVQHVESSQRSWMPGASGLRYQCEVALGTPNNGCYTSRFVPVSSAQCSRAATVFRLWQSGRTTSQAAVAATERTNAALGKRDPSTQYVTETKGSW